MCTFHDKQSAKPRYGSRLEHGRAHEVDHRRWSRRGFLGSLGALATGAFMFGTTPVRAFGASPVLSQLSNAASNRILLLIQLRGGNDGLNTVVPFNDDIYYNQRPAIAIPKSEASAFKLSSNLGTHPELSSLQSHFGEGNMAVVQNVGYPDFTLSHFRSTDIWFSGSDADVVESSGWIGRYLESEFPDFDTNPTEYPLAVQIGGAAGQVFKGPTTDMGMSLVSPQLLDRLLADGEVYDTSAVPATTFGEEMAFVRSIANSSFRYADAIKDAGDAGRNSVEYPQGDTKLFKNLATIARLIKGGLGAQIYHTSMMGFDTHANQLNSHGNLLRWMATGIDAFLRDMEDAGDTEILVMTYSEFGRRVGQNGSKGTDHGQAAPLFLFSSGLRGGLYGNGPNLNDLDGGNLRFEVDFRSVYGTILQDWFGFEPASVRSTLFGFPFERIRFVADPAYTSVEDPSEPVSFELGTNYPNPFRSATTISYSVEQSGPVLLEVFDLRGRKVRTLVDRSVTAGRYQVQFAADRLPSGTYLYRMQTAAGEQSRTMTVVR